MPFSQRAFFGEMPIVDSEKLPAGCGTVSLNAKLINTTLTPWRSPVHVTSPTKNGTKKTIYRWGESSTDEANFWFTWTTDVDVVRAPINGDSAERTYYTGDGVPKKTDQQMALTSGTNYPVSSYELGLPMPEPVGVTFTVTGSPVDATDSTLLGAYVLTYVSSWGEESATSEIAIGPFEFKNGQSITLGNLPVPPSGNWNLPIKRLYRSNSGSQGAAYQFVADIPAAQTTFTDSLLTEQLGETASTQGWYPPPDNGFGLTLGANGNAIMLAGRTVYACVPYQLSAWPDAYQNSVDSDLVGCGAFGQGFVILTKSFPYVLTGVDPEGYTLSKLGDKQACISKRSIVSMLGGVIYASPDGLWIVDGAGARSLTEKLFDKDQWKALNPATMHAVEYDGRYLAFFDSGAIIFDWTREPFIERLDINCTAAHLDPLRDTLYLAQGSNITKFDAGTPLTYTYRSADLFWPRMGGFSYAKVDAEAYPVTFRLYADIEDAAGTNTQQLVHTQVVTNRRPFRLPPVQTRRHQYQLEGTTTVKGVALAGSGDEVIKV